MGRISRQSAENLVTADRAYVERFRFDDGSPAAYVLRWEHQAADGPRAGYAYDGEGGIRMYASQRLAQRALAGIRRRRSDRRERTDSDPAGTGDADSSSGHDQGGGPQDLPDTSSSGYSSAPSVDCPFSVGIGGGGEPGDKAHAAPAPPPPGAPLDKYGAYLHAAR